jgi:hypothetical protein
VSALAWWLVEVRESDGNDGSVTDFIVEAESKETAGDRVMKVFTDAGHEEDGSWGTFAPCDCECEHTYGVCDDCADSWECSHGGASLPEPEDIQGPFDGPAQAKAAGSCYHSTVEMEAEKRYQLET